MEAEGVRILCFDNGGTRCLTQLSMVQELLNRTHGPQDDGQPSIRPSEAFDFITGSGLGGIIAVMLGHLQMTIGEAIEAYTKLLPAFTDTKWWSQDCLKWSNLLPCLKTLAQRHSLENAVSSDNPSTITRKTNVMIAVSRGSGGIPALLRNYSHDASLLPDFDFVEVCRAACATPGYFGPVKTDLAQETGRVYGAQGLPNIILETVTEAASIYPTSPIACVISLGTGMTVPDDDGPHRSCFCLPLSQKEMLERSSRNIAIAAEDAAGEFYALRQETMTESVYFRFNVEQGMQNILIETDENLSAVVAHARQYLKKVSVSQKLDSAAYALSHRKRQIVPAVVCPKPPKPKSGDEEFNTEDVEQFKKSCLEINKAVYNDFTRMFTAYQKPESSVTLLAFLDEACNVLQDHIQLVPGLNDILPHGYSLLLPSSKVPADVFIITYPLGAKVHCLNDISSNMHGVITTKDLDNVLADDEKWKNLKEINRPWTDCMAQLLQCKLDLDSQNAKDARTHWDRAFHLLRRFSRKQGVLPPSFFLSDLHCADKHPFAGGGYADVWKGKRRDETVCLKVLRIFTTDLVRDKTFKEFSNEALIWRQIRHPNVLPFLGIATDLFSPSLCLVSPYINHGNINDFLEKNPSHPRLSFIADIAAGLKYLHSFDPPIEHGDIRGANVLVKDDLTCCLGDFGLSTLSSSFPVTTASGFRGSIRWLAPEVLLPVDSARTVVGSRDVYAFACTVIEIFSGKPPFGSDIPDGAVILEVVHGKRPERPEGCEDSLWSIVQKCWNGDPTLRLSMVEVVNEFNRLQHVL